MTEPPSPPEAAGNKPAGEGRAEPLAGDVSRAAVAPAAKPAAPGKPPESTRTIAPPSGPPDPPPAADAPVPAFVTGLQAALPGAVEQLSLWVGDWTVIVPASRLLEVARHLRDTPGARFDFCSDLTASDWPPRAQRFDVIYSLYSTRLKHRVRIKVRAGRRQAVPTRQRHLAGGQLVRARSVRPVRHPVRRAPGPAANPDAGRMAGAPAAQGLSARGAGRAPARGRRSTGSSSDTARRSSDMPESGSIRASSSSTWDRSIPARTACSESCCASTASASSAPTS